MNGDGTEIINQVKSLIDQNHKLRKENAQLFNELNTAQLKLEEYEGLLTQFPFSLLVKCCGITIESD